MLLFGSVAGALERTQHWDVVSLTAEGITGDIDLSPSRIVFENGAALELSYVGSAPDVIQYMADDPPAKIYRIVKPEDLLLLHGNSLCGGTIPIYVAVMERPDELVTEWHQLFLDFISGGELPRAHMDQNRVCSGYSYKRVVENG